MRALLRSLKVFALTMLAYLTQACIVPYLAVDTIAPNVCFTLCAVLAVSLGIPYAFAAGALIGVFMELMAVNIELMQLVLYPVLAVAWGAVYADRSDRRRELRRAQDKSTRQLKAPARILLCVVCIAASYEVIMIAIIYLNGIVITGGHLVRALMSVAYTAAVTALLMWPIRKFLGMYASRRIRESA